MFIGIDIGCNGAAVIMDADGVIVDIIKFKDSTVHDIADWFNEWTDAVAMVEKVSSSPQMGVKSAFTFGQGLGQLEGILAARKIAFKYATPQTWQKAMKCMSKGDKNVTKAAAQRLYPDMKITHAIADAILIARYCCENW